ncbi:hypothetical protein ACHAQA_000824 [Verticillium albo-atrum]
MSDECAGCCAGCCLEIIHRIFVSLYFAVIEERIVKNRDKVIAWGRAVEDWLHLPTSFRPIYEGDPGLLDDEIRIAAVFLPFGFLLAVLAIPVLLDNENFVVGMVCEGLGLCLLLLVYLRLMLVKRRRLRRGWTEDEARGVELKTWFVFDVV